MENTLAYRHYRHRWRNNGMALFQEMMKEKKR